MLPGKDECRRSVDGNVVDQNLIESQRREEYMIWIVMISLMP